MKKRIWELDVLRGIFILGMVVVHFLYDLTDLYKIIQWDWPPAALFIKNWGGVLFFLISGISATLGSHSVRRGLIVIGSGLIVSAVTYGMYHFGFAGQSIIIYFGVLSCLGVCMLLWSTYKNMPWWGLLIHGILLAAVGLCIREFLDTGDLYIGNNYLMPLGLHRPDFYTSDYFPLLPNLGFFLIGSFLGKTVYCKKTSLLPKVNERNAVIRFFSFCGRQSLLIYLLHQPVLSGICMLITLL